MKIKAEIKGYSFGDDDNIPEKFQFLSYFYLHGKAEEINGHDLCYGNFEVFRKCLSSRIFPVRLNLNDGDTPYEGIVISYYKEGRMTGLICTCFDTEHIKHALFEYDERANKETVIEEGEKKWLYEKYPEIRKIVKEYNLSR